MQIPQLGQITFDKSRTFFRLVYEYIWKLKLFQKNFPFKLFSWTCELKFWQTRRRFCLPNSKNFLSSSLFVLLQNILLTRRMHIDNPIGFCPAKIENNSVMVRKKDRKTTCRMLSCQLRRKFVEVRPRQSSSRSQNDEGKNLILTEKPLFSKTFLYTRRKHFWQFRPRMSDKKLKFFRSIKNEKFIYFLNDFMDTYNAVLTNTANNFRDWT